MAIDNVAAFAHLTDEQVETLGGELDALRREIEESLGEADAAYIRGLVSLHRKLVVAGRITLFASKYRPAWIAGTAMMSVGKILENMEIGHNVMHGQWDWMNDPEIHSGTWEWDNTCPAEQWKHSHNYMHHTFTNVLGKDNDVGYGVLRVTPDQKWHPVNLGQPLFYLLLASFFEDGVALHDLDIEAIRKGTKDMKETRRQLKSIWHKLSRQIAKDYIVFPALSGPAYKSTMSANFTANVVRNIWSNIIIFCGHFPDGAEKFTEEQLDGETKAEWYLRQMYGSANFTGSKLLHIMSGSLGYQIEHHMFPDLPSNRFPQIQKRVRELCEEYDLPYTTGPLYKQYGNVLSILLRLSLPTPSTPPAPTRHDGKRSSKDELATYRGLTPPQAAVA